MNWLKQNWLKLMLLFVAIGILGYYLFVFSPLVEENTRLEKYERDAEKILIDVRTEQIADYREQCTETEKENQRSLDKMLEAARTICNQNNDPVSCMTSFIETQSDKFPPTGLGFVQACIDNMIERFGT